MRLVSLVGSIRSESYNQSIHDFIAERYSADIEIENVQIKDLPFFDQDLEEEPAKVVMEFKEEIAKADGVLIVTPEYNHSVPGMLKNALDWTSRVDKVMTGKPVLIVGASPGMLGTVRCQLHLRQIMASPGVAAKVLPGNEVFIGNVHEKLDDAGDVIDQGTIDYLDTVMGNFISFVKELQ